MNRTNNFCPATWIGVAVNATGESALGAGSEYQPDALIDNRGAADAYVAFGRAGITTAVGTGLRIPAGAMALFDKATATHIAVAVSSGSPSLVIHLGSGQ